MPLTQPNHDLKRDLQGISSGLKCSTVALKKIKQKIGGNKIIIRH